MPAPVFPSGLLPSICVPMRFPWTTTLLTLAVVVPMNDALAVSGDHVARAGDRSPNRDTIAVDAHPRPEVTQSATFPPGRSR